MTRQSHPDTRETMRQMHARNVRAARAYCGIDQAELSRALDVSLNTIKRMEGAHRDISHEELEAVASRCGVPLSFLLGGFERVIDEAQDMSAETIREMRDEIRELFERLSGALVAQQAGHQSVIADAVAPFVTKKDNNEHDEVPANAG